MPWSWDHTVLLLFIAATIVGFAWRRSRNQVLYGAWWLLMAVENWARKNIDKRGGPRGI